MKVLARTYAVHGRVVHREENVPVLSPAAFLVFALNSRQCFSSKSCGMLYAKQYLYLIYLLSCYFYTKQYGETSLLWSLLGLDQSDLNSEVTVYFTVMELKSQGGHNVEVVVLLR